MSALGGLSHAQEFRSTLTGRVADPSGAFVPNAKVAAIKTDTNSRFETVSGTEGFYTIPLLPPGRYDVTAQSAGFKKFVQSGIQIGTDTRVTQDITLAVGDTTESITVTADATPLSTGSASTGQVITSHEVENLPIDGRSPLTLAFLAFGAISSETRDMERPFENAGMSNFSLGGAATMTNELLMNGVPNLGTLGRRVAFSPPVDTVAEVKVEIFNVDASTGDTGGGTANITTKGGTNQPHGSLYEFNQASKLAATPFFINAAGGKKTVSRQNQYGGTFGGPVIIPKVFKGTDKLFFFFGYEGYKDSTPSPVTTSVPTAAERQGDFSALLNVGPTYQLYDPASAKTSGTQVTRSPFVGNLIPPSRLNTIAGNYLKFVPAPNQTGRADGANNFFANLTTGDDYFVYSGRLDMNLSNRNKLTWDLHTSKWQQQAGNVFHNTSNGEMAYRTTWGGMLDDVHTFAPTVLLDTRFGFTRFRPNYVQNALGYDPTQLGYPSYIAALSPRLIIPPITFSDGYQGITTGIHQTDQPLDTYQIFTSLTKITGRHALKGGAELRLQRFSNIDFSNSTGSYTFDSTWVKSTGTAGGQPIGGSMAAFLLGLPTSGTYAYNAVSTADSRYYAFFLQDDFHARSNLTVNLGLRWEYNTPTVERWNRQTTGFDVNAVNQTTAAARAAYAAAPLAQLPASQFNPVGGLLFASPSQRSAYQTPHTSFSPRLGITWTPTALHNRTVFRAGTGIFYYTYGVIAPIQPGFSSSNSFVPTNDNYQTPAATLSNPFPNGIVQPQGSKLGVNTYLGQSVSFTNPDLQNQYSFRWNLDTQHQLAKNLIVQLGYIGNHSVHLTSSPSLSALPTQYLSRSPFRDTATINALAASVPNPFANLLPGTTKNGPTVAASSLLAPFPEFSGVTLNSANSGGSYFHQIAARVQQRFSSGLLFSVNYQHSRLMEKNSRLNPSDPTLEKRISGSDRPNRFVFSGTYELPFGKGKHLASGANRVVNTIIGDWALASVYVRQSGAVLGWSEVIYSGGDLQWNPRNISRVFDTTQFNTVSTQQLANHFRTFPSQFNNLRSDRTSNVNFTVTKDFHLFERLKLQYRAEAFNACNRAQFAAPNMSPTSSAFAVTTATTQQQPRAIQMALRLSF
jgi:hypothetical protein